jgi:Subtilase family
MSPAAEVSSTAPSARVAVIDSGVHSSHPHVAGVTGGVAFDARGRAHHDFVDRLGHGTAVTAVIREKAPLARIYAVKVFDRELRTEIEALLAGLDWAIAQGVQLVNLSLGTAERRHEAALAERVARAAAGGVLVVSPLRAPRGEVYLPGALPGVLPVELDWSCPRDDVRAALIDGGPWICRASGYPRPIPGVSPERNLKGLSFAVANITGWLAQRLEGDVPVRLQDARRLVAQDARAESR